MNAIDLEVTKATGAFDHEDAGTWALLNSATMMIALQDADGRWKTLTNAERLAALAAIEQARVQLRHRLGLTEP
jgi:hypothetical protein